MYINNPAPSKKTFYIGWTFDYPFGLKPTDYNWVEVRAWNVKEALGLVASWKNNSMMYFTASDKKPEHLI